MKQDYKVNININDEIDGDKAIITIEGDDDKMVEECFNKMNLIHRNIEIKKGADSLRNISPDYYIRKYNLV